MSGGAGGYQRSTSGMIGAMLVLLAVVAAFVTFRALVRNEVVVPVKTVDYQRTLEYAQDRADFRLLAPEQLPEGWRATSVEFVPQSGRWELGVLTASDRYIGLVQSASSEQKLVETYVDQDAVHDGTVQIDGRSWRTWSDEDGDTAVTRQVEGEVTALVVTPAGLDALVEYVETLR